MQIFYFQNNAAYHLHLHSKIQKDINFATVNKENSCMQLHITDYIDVLIYSHSSSCISEKFDHAYIMCLGGSPRSGTKDIRIAVLVFSYLVSKALGWNSRYQWDWVSHIAQWLTELGLWNWFTMGQVLHAEELLLSFLSREQCLILPLFNLMNKLQIDMAQNSN